MTIIVPVYNQVEYLADAIDSALSQTIKCEVIVVDDGSTDGSGEVADKYKIRVIHQVNKGLASARNTGIMNARSDWVIFLDADDILLENYAQKILEQLSGVTVDIIAPSFKEFGLSNREVVLMPSPTIENFKTGNRIGYCAAVRRSALLTVGGYNPKMQEGYEDLHLTINLLSIGKRLVTIPEVLWLYRTKKESMFTKITPEIHKKLIAQINKDFPNVELKF